MRRPTSGTRRRHQARDVQNHRYGGEDLARRRKLHAAVNLFPESQVACLALRVVVERRALSQVEKEQGNLRTKHGARAAERQALGARAAGVIGARGRGRGRTMLCDMLVMVHAVSELITGM